MSFLSALQELKSHDIGPLSDYGQWLHESIGAFVDNYSPDASALDTLKIVLQVWPDLSESNSIVLLDNLINSDGEMAYDHSDIKKAVNHVFKQPKIKLNILAKLPQDTSSEGPRWQNTDVIVEPGYQVDIKYVSGQWTANPNTGLVDADGNSTYKAKEGYTLPGENEGALVGRVINNEGPSPVFLVGKSCTVPSDLKGYLELGINDDLSGQYGEGFEDNEGSLLVEIDSVNGLPPVIHS